MSQVSYELKNGHVIVRLGRRVIGSIRKADGGYQYVTTTGARGEIFPTVAAVKRSLEEA